MKIEKFDRDNLKMLRPEIQSVLDMIKDEYGISLSIGNISFSSNRFTTRLTATIPGASAEEQPDEDDQFADLSAKILGFKKNPVGMSFKVARHTYTVKGLKLNRKKFPVSCIRDDGKKFKFGVDTVKIQLGMPGGTK